MERLDIGYSLGVLKPSTGQFLSSSLSVFHFGPLGFLFSVEYHFKPLIRGHTPKLYINHTFFQLKWWTGLFDAIKKTTPISENEGDKDSRAEAEEFFLDKFRNFMNNKIVS